MTSTALIATTLVVQLVTLATLIFIIVFIRHQINTSLAPLVRFIMQGPSDARPT